MRWVVALGGWFTAGALLFRYRRLQRTSQSIITESVRVVSEAQAVMADVYRVKLSCPACDWTDVVVRETRAAAMAEGNARIFTHNVAMDHQLSGVPRPGYFRGEPLN